MNCGHHTMDKWKSLRLDLHASEVRDDAFWSSFEPSKLKHNGSCLSGVMMCEVLWTTGITRLNIQLIIIKMIASHIDTETDTNAVLSTLVTRDRYSLPQKHSCQEIARLKNHFRIVDSDAHIGTYPSAGTIQCLCHRKAMFQEHYLTDACRNSYDTRRASFAEHWLTTVPTTNGHLLNTRIFDAQVLIGLWKR